MFEAGSGERLEDGLNQRAMELVLQVQPLGSAARPMNGSDSEAAPVGPVFPALG